MRTPTPAPARRSLAARAAVAIVLMLVAALLASCGGDSGDGDGDKGDQGRTANAAYQRLDGALTRNLSRSGVVRQRPFACLNSAPAGGPALAKCAPQCGSCAADVRQMSARVRSVYDSSPAYLRRIYRAAYRSEQRTLDMNTQALEAMGDYARVHGASAYAGSAEFARIKTLFARIGVAQRQTARRIRQARQRWYGYAEQRWDLQY